MRTVAEYLAKEARAGFRSAEIETIVGFEEKAHGAQKELTGRKTNTPAEAFRYLEKLPLEQTAYLLAESGNSAAVSKIKAYLNKWRPVRAALTSVATELEALGMERGAKFDEIVEQVFAMQLTGRGKTPEERVKTLRKLSGIKEQPKNKEKEKKPPKGTDKAHAAAAMGDAAKQKHDAARKSAKPAASVKGASAKLAAKHAAPSKGGKSAVFGKKSSGRK